MIICVLIFTFFMYTNTVEGRNVNKGEFPFMVTMISEKYTCGGTLMTLRDVITAGKCVVNDNYIPVDEKQVKVIAGALKLPHSNNDKATQKRDVAKIWFHDNFLKKNDSIHYYHNIALLVLKTLFILSDTVYPAKLPTTDYYSFKEAWGTIASEKKSCFGIGWGTSGSGGKSEKSQELKAFELNPLEREKCKANVSSKDLDMTEFGEVCAESNEKEGACGSELGGPLFCSGHVYAFAISVIECSQQKTQFFLLFGPYMEYFELAPPRKININIDGLRGAGFLNSANQWLLLSLIMLSFHKK